MFEKTAVQIFGILAAIVVASLVAYCIFTATDAMSGFLEAALTK